MKIFIGGKIQEGEFRNGLVDGNLRYRYDDNGETLKDYEAMDKLLSKGESIVLENVINGEHDYTGAFFIGSNDSSEAENMGETGKNTVKRKQVKKSKRLVANMALKNIEACDMFFAWLDTDDAHGTHVEIGYAKALGKPIYLAGYQKDDDLWFVYKMSDEPFIYHDVPKEALNIAIDSYKKYYQ